MTSRRKGRPYRRLQERVRRGASVCWICGEPIDKSAPYRDPVTGEVNPMAFSVDHVEPVDMRPDLMLDPNNVRAAHMRCNSSRGRGDASGKRQPQSRAW